MIITNSSRLNGNNILDEIRLPFTYESVIVVFIYVNNKFIALSLCHTQAPDFTQVDRPLDVFLFQVVHILIRDEKTPLLTPFVLVYLGDLVRNQYRF